MRLLAEIALVVVAALGVAVCVRLLPGLAAKRARADKPPPPSRPKQLVTLERLVSNAETSTVHVHAYLRPLLAEIASHRLAARGQPLARMPEAVRGEILGEQLWDIVRPERPFPEDRYGPGVSSCDLSAMVEVLERL